ncbi:WXG100 family type VII secretion target [Kitasatospora sp. NPDC001539]|uniref:WXG100 family type VII secretion target n=1 Tax=Kitasatospora sp. NPDC001539 TaxID=3154384 RepID=UPI00332E3B28
MATESNFEGMDHAVLKGMVEDTDPASVLSRGTKLQAAGRVLAELSGALKAHLSQVTWEGQAAENFKTWANNLQQSAEKLGTYSAGAGDAMHQAGEALSTAKAAVPPVPPDALKWVNGRKSQGAPDPAVITQLQSVGWNPNGPSTADIDAAMKRKRGADNWVSETEAMAGTKELYDAHQEAIHQMEKLGQAYAAATTKLNGLGDIALPGTPAPSNQNDSTAIQRDGGSGGGYGGSVRAARSDGGGAAGSHGSSVGDGGGSVTPRDPGTNWHSPSNPGHTGTTPPHGGGQLPSAPQDPGSSVPPSHPSDPVNHPGTDLNSLPTLPDQTVPTTPGTGPLLPGGGPTYPSGPGGGPGVLPGGGPVTGFPFGPGGSIPTKGTGGGSIPARPVPFGGGNVPGKSGTPGLPSGTVFGREAGPTAGGRPGSPMGGGMGMNPGIGGGHGVVGAGGSSRGRGLAFTPGGAVGGRKGPAAGGEFTPGGTGLRNRAAAAEAAEGGARSGQNGMMAPGVSGHGGRTERNRRNRADYLHEDEETWTNGTPESNPDVIE